MRVLRRVVFPIIWLLIFAVIAVALVKIAFVDGLKDPGEHVIPGARLEAPVIETTRATVTNKVEVTGTVQSDAAVPVRSTAAGQVVYFFVEKGEQLAVGDRIFQIRSEVAPQPGALTANLDAAKDGEGPSTPQRAPEPVYTYTNVLATSAGTLETLLPLLNQETSVGENAGTISPGTFSIKGSLTTAQQFRLLGLPASATGTVTNGPAPFSCGNVQMSNSTAGSNDNSGTGVGAAGPGGFVGSSSGGGGESGSGQVSCAVPAGVAVFPGLGSTIILTAGEAKDVLTLPLTSVKGSVQNGVVWVPAVDGLGAPVERNVVLGLNDGERVEITSGLAEGEQVLQFVPGADAVLPEGQPGGYPMMMGG